MTSRIKKEIRTSVQAPHLLHKIQTSYLAQLLDEEATLSSDFEPPPREQCLQRF